MAIDVGQTELNAEGSSQHESTGSSLSSTRQDSSRSTSNFTLPNNTNSALPHVRPELACQASFQRPRTKLFWRGKTCVIAFPLEDPRTKVSGQQYLTPQDVSARLEAWRHKGHDTTSFRLSDRLESDSIPPLSEGQTRPDFPDPDELAEECRGRPYRVSIPDRSRWDAYVSQLKEERLRSLGVSIRDEGKGKAGPVSLPSMSRKTSSQSSNLPLSPRLKLSPTISLHSNFRSTAGFQHSPTGSQLSQQNGTPGVAHVPKDSFVWYQEENASLPYELSKSVPPIPSPWSPHPYRSQPGSRTMSPAIKDIEQVLDSKVDSDRVLLHNSTADLSMRDSIGPPFLQQMQYIQTPHLSPSASQDPSNQGDIFHRPGNHSSSKTFDLHPEPRGKVATGPSLHVHRQNVRDSLQADISSTETESQGGATRFHEDAAKNAKAMNVSSQRDLAYNVEKKHDIKPTASSLNAEAAEFAFKPQNPAVTTEVFAFLGNTQSVPIKSTKMRPTAPDFTPTSVSSYGKPLQEFSFSSNGPSFQFSRDSEPDDLETRGQSPAGKPEKIFRNINFSDFIQPTKKSRAIPIVRPDIDHEASVVAAEVQEDELGRITQAEGRQKRLRRDIDQNNRTAQFTSSSRLRSPSIDKANGPPSLGSLSHQKRHTATIDATTLVEATDASNHLKELIDGLSASDDSYEEQASIESQSGTSDNYKFSDTNPTMALGANRYLSSSKNVENTSCLEKRAHSESSTDSPGSSALLTSPTFDGIDLERIENHVTTMVKDLQDYADQTSTSDSSVSTNRHRRPPKEHQPSHSRSISGNQKGPEALKDSLANGVSYISHRVSEAPNLIESIIDGVTYIEPSQLHNISSDERLEIADLNEGLPSNSRNWRYQDREEADVNDVGDYYQKRSSESEKRLESDSLSPIRRHRRQDQRSSSDRAPDNTQSRVGKARPWNTRSRVISRPSDYHTGAQGVAHVESADTAAISDWGDAISSVDENLFHSRAGFFDSRVSDLVGSAIQHRLEPVEKILRSIQSRLPPHSNPETGQQPCLDSVGTVEHSDADDEEDEQLETSQTRLKSSAIDSKYQKLHACLSDILAVQRNLAPAGELSKVSESVKRLEASLQQIPTFSSDIRSVVEDAVAKQMRGRSGPITSSHQSAAVEKYQLQITGLESMLKIAETRAEDELKARRATEDALADNQRLLRLALQDAAEQRESAEETERSLSAFHEERHQALRHSAMLEGTQESLQKINSEMAEKINALEGTLEEYRLSSQQWREEIETTTNRNHELLRTVNQLKAEVEDGINGRQTLRARFDQLQNEMSVASQNIARDQSLWRSKEESYRKRCDDLEAALESESEARKQTVVKLEELGSLNEKHLTTLDALEQAKKNNARLEAELNDLQSTANEQRAIVMRSELELQDAERTSQERYILQETTLRVLKAEQETAMKAALEEKQRAETYFNAQLALATERNTHYEERIRHLEERLHIAKSAASAAVQAAQSKQTASSSPARSSPNTTLGADLPEKVSPQALRESILVLQEQLHDRESKIEELEQQLLQSDIAAPAKLKNCESEIVWLRELLSVRHDELEDIISTLSQPVFDHEATKEAAIRLRANLQMQQQERERVRGGGPKFPSFSGISNLTSSPRALPLAAAAAWGNWRKGREAPFSNRSELGYNSASQTPSRVSPSIQSFLSGLMTPPSTDLRLGAQINTTPPRGGPSPRSKKSESRGRSSEIRTPSSKETRRPQDQSPPLGVRLTQKTSYDRDAPSADWSEATDGTADLREEVEEEEPFGASIAAFQGGQ
ncbi:MAG: hypothetical protein LQ342_001632 [Letrouitia transgressa]|nr:MAG: hypothetical protein LQ342_001632 [Letrouitia transgressa]